MKKLKIGIIGSRGYPYVYSGYETLVKELATRLIKRQVEVSVYCHKNLFSNYPKKVNGVNLVYISTIEKKMLSQFIHSFQSIIHSIFKRFDLILVVNSANGPFGLITKIFRKKTLINVDGLEWKRPKWKGFGAKYFYLASKLSTKFYDIIITDSKEMEKVYRKEFNRQSSVIAYGANIKFSKEPKLIKKWGLAPRGYYLVVARMVPDNNGALIVREFLKSGSSKQLVIVGDVPYDDDYARRLKAEKDPRLIFPGYVRDQEELAELYHNCDIYFHGHEFGGTNPALLEALGNGCAICALDTVFNRETLANGKYGMFFSKSSNHLKGMITELESNPGRCTGLREISRDRIREAYTWEKVTEQYFNLFKRCVNKK